MEDCNMFTLSLLTLLFICQYSGVNSEPSWKFHNMKQYWPLNLYYDKELNSHLPDSYVPGQIVQVAPKYPVWKIHKYSGIQLKPVSTIPVLKVEIINDQHRKTIKHHLPPIEEIQNILGTNSMIETVETLKELASTDDGRKMMANYIKASFPGLEISEGEIVSAIQHYQADVLKGTNTHATSNTFSETPSPITSFINHSKKEKTFTRIPKIQPESITTFFPKRIIDSHTVNLKGSTQSNNNGQSFLWFPKSFPHHESNLPVLQANNFVYREPLAPIKIVNQIPDLKINPHNNYVSRGTTEKFTKENNIPNFTINSTPIVVAEEKVEEPLSIDASPHSQFGPEFQKPRPIQEVKEAIKLDDNVQMLPQNINLNRETKEPFKYSTYPISNLEGISNKGIFNQVNNGIKITKEDHNNRPVISIKYEYPNFSYTQLSEVSKMSDAVKPFEQEYVIGNKESTLEDNYRQSENRTTISSDKYTPNINYYYAIPKEEPKQSYSRTPQYSGFNPDYAKKYEIHQSNSSEVDDNIPSKLPFSVSPSGIKFQQFENNVISPLLHDTNPEEFIKLAFTNSVNKQPYNTNSQQYNLAAFVPTKDPNKFMFALENTMVNNKKSEEVKVTHDKIISNGRPVNSLNYDHPNLSFTQLSEIPLSEYDYPKKSITSYDAPISGYSQPNDLLPSASENAKTEIAYENKNDNESSESSSDKDTGNVIIKHETDKKNNLQRILKTKEKLSGTTVIYAISSNPST